MKNKKLIVKRFDIDVEYTGIRGFAEFVWIAMRKSIVIKIIHPSLFGKKIGNTCVIGIAKYHIKKVKKISEDDNNANR